MSLNMMGSIDKSKAARLHKINSKRKRSDQFQILPVVLASIFIVLILEMLSRRSINKGLEFVFVNPLMFLFNILIVLLTLTVTMLFSRRTFFLIVISVAWLSLGIINYIILCFRSTPFTAMDFYLIKSAIGLIPYYLNTFQLILIIGITMIIIIAMIYLWKKVKKLRRQYKISILIMGLSSVLMLLLTSMALDVGKLSKEFGNLPDAYSDYGFVYCFTNSVFERGIHKPEAYSIKQINRVLNQINRRSTKIYSNDNTVFSMENSSYSEKNPNVIMIQLESFFDVNQLLDFTFSENPVPNFTNLKQEYSSGYLRVPAYGAGTINTEFEILTGMNTDFFGTGEYPFRTILKSTTCESICYNLSELGYQSYAIHNNTGTFYSRNNIYRKIGFDHFCSIEYMNNVFYNPIGWAKDHVLTEQIMKALSADDSRNFIYTITVQPHGKYPSKAVDDNKKITVSTDPGKRLSMEVSLGYDKIKATDRNYNPDDSYLNQIEYYVNQLYDTDQFIGDLIQALSDCKEPAMVLLFGDHLPPLSFEDDDLLTNNKFLTEYVLWSNFPMKNVKQDLNAYQLNAYLMSRLGFDNGIITKFHQRCIGTPDYQENLKLLQYDMLYGKRYVYGRKNPYQESILHMGILDAKISDVEEDDEKITIYGENFTPCSVVYINDHPKKTTFMSESALLIPYEDIADKEIYVAQVTQGKKILSKSELWSILKKEEQ
jgi:phosphoglycerol transferase MdoB-like AlkP superfamily enzyme